MRATRDTQRRDNVVNTDGHVIGVDIGATGIRVAILAQKRHDDPAELVVVEDSGEVPLPDNAVVDGVVVEPQVVTRALAELWKAAAFGCRQVIVGVSNSQAVVRLVTMPNLPPDQLARAIPFQARDVIALPLDKAVLDFRRLPRAEGDERTDTIDGVLVATPRQPVLTAVRAVEAAGLRVARVDLASFAALRAVATPGLAAEAVVDIGAQVTNIVIHHRGVPRVVRTLARGGQVLTDKLVERTGAGAKEAEILKREIGVLGSDSEAAMILASAVRPLVSDIRSSIQYFATTNTGVELGRVALTGGGARLPGLVDLLSNDVGLPCEIVSPVVHVRDAARQRGSRQRDSRQRDDRQGNDRQRDDREPEGRHREPAATPLSAVAVGLALGAAA